MEGVQEGKRTQAKDPMKTQGWIFLIFGLFAVAIHRRYASYWYRRRYEGKRDLLGKPIPARVERWMQLGCLILGMGFVLIGLQALFTP